MRRRRRRRAAALGGWTRGARRASCPGMGAPHVHRPSLPGQRRSTTPVQAPGAGRHRHPQRRTSLLWPRRVLCVTVVVPQRCRVRVPVSVPRCPRVAPLRQRGLIHGPGWGKQRGTQIRVLVAAGSGPSRPAQAWTRLCPSRRVGCSSGFAASCRAAWVWFVTGRGWWRWFRACRAGAPGQRTLQPWAGWRSSGASVLGSGCPRSWW
mmetsp:Transcript_58015/g.154971  ORF Transcript_58015/g.154971 Transcript_58015/m.154971 type:complete len:207 (+) Transcript_58015:1408-2028(+)